MSDGSDSDGDDGGSGGGRRPSVVQPPRFVQLLKAHREALERRARRLPKISTAQAEDLVAEVWLYAYLKLDELERHPNVRAWLLRVLGNKYVDLVRPNRVLVSQEVLAHTASDDLQFERFEKHDTLKLALQILEPRVAEVMKLRLEGLKLTEIARRLHISTAEAGRRCATGLLQLGEFIRRNTT